VPCARLSWPSRELLSASKSTVSYRIKRFELRNDFDVSGLGRGRFVVVRPHSTLSLRCLMASLQNVEVKYVVKFGVPKK